MPCSGVFNDFCGKFTALWITKKDIFRKMYSQASKWKAYQKEERFELPSSHLSKLFQSVDSYLSQKIEWEWLLIGLARVPNWWQSGVVCWEHCSACLLEMQENYKVLWILAGRLWINWLRGICVVKAVLFFSFVSDPIVNVTTRIFA